jgi:squalene-hopene/tetraprenyl-beta-curcumene cyclase
MATLSSTNGELASRASAAKVDVKLGQKTYVMMVTRLIPLTILLAVPVLSADWSPRAAADYLDSRQKEWFAWPRANKTATPCVSCHTGATYLMARPALRRVLGEKEPTRYETGLLTSLSSRVSKRSSLDLFPDLKDPMQSNAAGVEAIFAALFLRTPDAIDRMWSWQTAGRWAWDSFDLDPWETPQSAYFGASLAALAVAGQPARPEIAELNAYLRREFDAQPLHNRLAVLWASTSMPDALPPGSRRALLAQLWSRQSADGGWTLDAIGPWKRRSGAPVAQGASAYATAYVAAMLVKAGVSGPQLDHALVWLRSHQNPKGYWEAASMNKVRDPGSIPEGFMRDAATAYAAMALAR